MHPALRAKAVEAGQERAVPLWAAYLEAVRQLVVASSAAECQVVEGCTVQRGAHPAVEEDYLVVGALWAGHRGEDLGR